MFRVIMSEVSKQNKLPASWHDSILVPPSSLLSPCTPSTHFWDHWRFIPDWAEKVGPISCCFWQGVGQEQQEGVGTGIENVLGVSLGLASLTNKSSFTMHRLKGKNGTSETGQIDNPTPQQRSCSHCHSATKFFPYPYCACHPGSLAGTSTFPSPLTEPNVGETV